MNFPTFLRNAWASLSFVALAGNDWGTLRFSVTFSSKGYQHHGFICFFFFRPIVERWQSSAQHLKARRWSSAVWCHAVAPSRRRKWRLQGRKGNKPHFPQCTAHLLWGASKQSDWPLDLCVSSGNTINNNVDNFNSTQGVWINKFHYGMLTKHNTHFFNM